MAEIKEYTLKTEDGGVITISEDVITSISEISAKEVSGVASVGAPANVTDFFGMFSGKDVKVTFGEDSVEIAITIIVKKGQIIPTVAKNVQSGIISAVESMTGLKVNAVNVKVAGISFEKPAKKKPDPAEEKKPE